MAPWDVQAVSPSRLPAAKTHGLATAPFPSRGYRPAVWWPGPFSGPRPLGPGLPVTVARGEIFSMKSWPGVVLRLARHGVKGGCQLPSRLRTMSKPHHAKDFFSCNGMARPKRPRAGEPLRQVKLLSAKKTKADKFFQMPLLNARQLSLRYPLCVGHHNRNFWSI